MYVPFIVNADTELTQDELNAAAEAADDFATYRFQSEEF